MQHTSVSLPLLTPARTHVDSLVTLEKMIGIRWSSLYSWGTLLQP